MSETDANDQATSRQTAVVRAEKKIIGYEEGNDPELEPLFSNYLELFQIGTDVYLDIGIVRPRDIVDLKQKAEAAPSEVHSLTFNVLQRIAMSRDTFERLKASVEAFAAATKGEKVAD